MKHSLFKYCLIAIIILLISACNGSPKKTPEPAEEDTGLEEIRGFIPAPEAELPVSAFSEIWGYVVAGYEPASLNELPVSDIGYFGAEIDMYGSLTKVPKRQNLPAFSGRVHLVAVCHSYSITHFALMPGSSERRALIADLLAAARNFDGLQIDFENVPARDGEAFHSFLRELKAGLGNKIFTAALQARTRKLSNDVYDYEVILPLVDKILVMGYDEHWSGSKPGSVASLQWCRRVAEYSLRTIGADKLIMGIPFYGRAWGDTPTSRALNFPTTETLLNTMDVKSKNYENGIPTFDYDVTVSVKVFYEDEYSLSARMQIYNSMNIKAIGFWRLGQETPKVWEIIKLGNN